MEKELSDKVLKIMRQLGDMPLIDNKIYKSKDGKYIINEVRIKTIKPTSYYEAIIKDAGLPYEEKRGEGSGRSN